jgi:hypothetical protein
MRNRTRALAATTALALGSLVVGAPAGAVTGSVTASCQIEGTASGPPTIRTFNDEAHAPDSVPAGATFGVSLDVGYQVPPNATAGFAQFDLTGATAPADGFSVAGGALSIQGSLVPTATGPVGGSAVVSVRRFGAYTQIGDRVIGELCTPVHTAVVARIGIGVPQVSIGDAAVVEGSSGTRAMEFPVTLSRPAATDVTVTFGTESGTATAGADFTTLSGSVTVHAGFVSGIATVRVRGDSTVESTENLRVRLVGPSGAVLGRAVGTGRIVDDDPEPGPRISIGDNSVVEGARGTRSARFVVSLSAAAPEDVTFHYTTIDGTAVAGVDYRAQDSEYHIPAGHTSISVPVPVIADRLAEPNRSFTVRLTSSNAAIGRANGVGTIIDDD